MKPVEGPVVAEVLVLTLPFTGVDAAGMLVVATMLGLIGGTIPLSSRTTLRDRFENQLRSS